MIKTEIARFNSLIFCHEKSCTEKGFLLEEKRNPFWWEKEPFLWENGLLFYQSIF